MADAIVVEGIGKRYRRYHADRPRTFKEMVVRRFRRLSGEEHWALRDINLRVAPGRMVGVIGANGAGKSTLLRLIGGVGRPDEGRVSARGRIGALLDLGSGQRPDLTGRENVFISGVIDGLTRREVAERFDSIVDFAELEDAIDNPLRTYSSGMQMRLAFAVAAHTQPDVLLIDEVLTVGDIAFQRKCVERIALFKQNGCTIVLVTHDPSQVRQLCDEAIWLEAGRLMAHGPVDVVVDGYVDAMTRETRRRTPTARPARRPTGSAELQLNANRFGSLEAELTDVRLLNRWGHRVEAIASGDPLRVEIDYVARQPIGDPIFGVSISRDDDTLCYDVSTEHAGVAPSMIHGPGSIRLGIDRLDLNAGAYYVDVGVYERRWAYAYDYHWHTYPLVVAPTGAAKGIIHPPSRWEVGTAAPPAGEGPARRVLQGSAISSSAAASPASRWTHAPPPARGR